MKPLAIVVTGKPSSVVAKTHGPFWWHIRQTVGAAWAGPWTLCDSRAGSFPSAVELAGVLITGSHDSVTELQPWIQATADWLRSLVCSSVPVLGLCFGHQLLGYALGGEIARHPGGPEHGTVPLEVLAPDDLVGPVPESIPYVNMLHEDTVVRLPPNSTVLARTAHEPHAAVRFAPRIWGLQFHPEFSGAIVRSYLSSMRNELVQAGRDPDALLAATSDTPWSAAILRRFAALAVQAERGGSGDAGCRFCSSSPDALPVA